MTAEHILEERPAEYRAESIAHPSAEPERRRSPPTARPRQPT